MAYRRITDFLICSVALLGFSGCVPSEPPGPTDLESYFEAAVQPNLEYCRTCHIPNGSAPLLGSTTFMLSTTRSQDYTKVKAAWSALGGGVTNNELLTQPASSSHTGGRVWPVGSSQYNAMRDLLECWNAPASCTL